MAAGELGGRRIRVRFAAPESIEHISGEGLRVEWAAGYECCAVARGHAASAGWRELSSGRSPPAAVTAMLVQGR